MLLSPPNPQSLRSRPFPPVLGGQEGQTPTLLSPPTPKIGGGVPFLPGLGGLGGNSPPPQPLGYLARGVSLQPEGDGQRARV